jgi:nucleoside-diphosphate-sugar epimerase
MKIFIAGATGAIGSRLVPLLIAAGHEVTGTSRSGSGARRIDAAGGHGVVMDALDEASVRRAVLDARPEVLVHELTALSGGMDFAHIERSFAITNELRTRGTDMLIAAAQQAGTRRILVQSHTGWTNEHSGSRLKSEQDPLDPHPVPATRSMLAAIAHAERAAVEAGGLALRYGALYGPGQSIGAGGDTVEAVRKRRVPVVGDGAGVWSFCHVDDAASATAAAVTRGAPGVYNIVDNQPVTASEWVPGLARAIGAKPPMRVPAWLARLMVGEFGVAWMTTARGSSNAKAKAELGWAPQYGSWREGFRTGLGMTEASGAVGTRAA